MPPLGLRRSLVAACIALFGLALGACTPGRHVRPVYLTWSDEDTSRTMTVSYHTRSDFAGSFVYYDIQPHGGKPERYASQARGFERRIVGVEQTVHVVPLSGLRPGTTYWFVAGDPVSGFSREESFRTLPGDGSPVRFVAGGDMGTGWWSRMTSRQAARTDPDFALLGGDLAYCRGGPEGDARWRQWFEDWDASMRAPDGRLIPLVAAIGNHDRSDRGGHDPAKVARFFSGFLYQDPGGRSYFTRRFGPRMAVFVLDSGHLARQAGAQASWLEAQLRATADLPVRFALYHVALFPAHQPIGDSVRAERVSWLPLFDAFHLTAAFEHHGHLHKRTKPLRAGVPATDGTGIVYFGDGDWGKSHAKEPKPEREYLAAASSQRHFWQVTVSEQGIRYQAIDSFGHTFDRAAQDASGAWIPEAAP